MLFYVLMIFHKFARLDLNSDQTSALKVIYEENRDMVPMEVVAILREKCPLFDAEEMCDWFMETYDIDGNGILEMTEVKGTHNCSLRFKISMRRPLQP